MKPWLSPLMAFLSLMSLNSWAETSYSLQLSDNFQLRTCSRYVGNDGDFEDQSRSPLYSPDCAARMARHPQRGQNALSVVAGSLGQYLYPRASGQNRANQVRSLFARLFPTRLAILSEGQQQIVFLGQPNYGNARSETLVSWLNPDSSYRSLRARFGPFSVGSNTWWSIIGGNRTPVAPSRRTYPVGQRWMTVQGLAQDLGFPSQEAERLGFGCSIKRESYAKYTFTGGRLQLAARIVYRLHDLTDGRVNDTTLVQIRTGLGVSASDWNDMMTERRRVLATSRGFRPLNGPCAAVMRAARASLREGLSSSDADRAGRAMAQQKIFRMDSSQNMQSLRHLEIGAVLSAPAPQSDPARQ